MKVEEFANLLFELEVNTHIYHLQTKSYAKHMALGGFYDGIADLRDKFIEDYQGQYGIIKNYGTVKVFEGLEPEKYLEARRKEVSQFRLTLTEGFLQQDLDDILSLFSSTLYKLKNLN